MSGMRRGGGCGACACVFWGSGGGVGRVIKVGLEFICGFIII